MKSTLVTLMLLVSTLCPAAPVEDFTVKAQTIVRSQYVGFDDGLVFYPHAVLQGNVTLGHSSGFFLDLWYSSGFNSEWSTDFDDELDYTAGWAGKAGNLDLLVSVAYYDDFQVGSGPYNDVIKGNFRLGFPQTKLGSFTVTPFASYGIFLIPDSSTPFDGGNVFALGFDSEIKITDRLSIASSTQLAWDDGVFGVKSGAFVKHASTVNFAFTPHLTWNALEATVYIPFGGRGLQAEAVWGTGLSWSF